MSIRGLLEREIVRKLFAIYIVVGYASLPILGVACADGGMVARRPISEEIFHPFESSQQAIIHYDDGWESMLVAIDFQSGEGENTAWILPVPSDPDQIDVDAALGIPGFKGVDIVKRAKHDLADSVNEFYPMIMGAMISPCMCALMYTWSQSFASDQGGSMGGGTEGSPGSEGASVTVHGHFETAGLIIEIITAKGGGDIFDYLGSNGLNISKGSIPQLDDYVDWEYSFIVTWVADQDRPLTALGLVLEFPSPRIYYPLILTSIYGNEVIDIQILVFGHVTPLFYDEIARDSKTTFWRGKQGIGIGNEINFKPLSSVSLNDRFDFTLIEISTQASNLEHDLIIHERAPLKARTAIFVHDHFGGGALAPMFFLILFTAMPLSLLMGCLFIGRKKELIPYYVMYGLVFIGGFGMFGALIAILLTHKKRYPLQKGMYYLIAYPLSLIITTQIVYVTLFSILIY